MQGRLDDSEKKVTELSSVLQICLQQIDLSSSPVFKTAPQNTQRTALNNVHVIRKIQTDGCTEPMSRSSYPHRHNNHMAFAGSELSKSVSVNSSEPMPLNVANDITIANNMSNKALSTAYSIPDELEIKDQMWNIMELHDAQRIHKLFESDDIQYGETAHDQSTDSCNSYTSDYPSFEKVYRYLVLNSRDLVPLTTTKISDQTGEPLGSCCDNIRDMSGTIPQLDIVTDISAFDSASSLTEIFQEQSLFTSTSHAITYDMLQCGSTSSGGGYLESVTSLSEYDSETETTTEITADSKNWLLQQLSEEPDGWLMEVSAGRFRFGYLGRMVGLNLLPDF